MNKERSWELFERGRENLTADEAREVLQAVRELVPDEILLFLYDTLQKQYAKGKRCGVCGMTPEQSEAIGYDCVYEC